MPCIVLILIPWATFRFVIVIDCLAFSVKFEKPSSLNFIEYCTNSRKNISLCRSINALYFRSTNALKSFILTVITSLVTYILAFSVMFESISLHYFRSRYLSNHSSLRFSLHSLFSTRSFKEQLSWKVFLFTNSVHVHVHVILSNHSSWQLSLHSFIFATSLFSTCSFKDQLSWKYFS